jgi:hypothetical protein
MEPLPWLKADHGEAHGGFIRALTPVLPQVHQKLQEFQPRMGPQKKVFLTGHSLGAALCTLLAMNLRGILMKPTIELKENAPPVVQGARPFIALTVYTFGSPRVMDDKLAAAYDHGLKNRTFCIVHGQDVATQVVLAAVGKGKLTLLHQVPPYSFGYTHVGQPVYISSDGEVRRDDEPPERHLSLRWDRIQRFFGYVKTILELATNGVGDHFLGRGPLDHNGPFPSSLSQLLKFVVGEGYLGALALACKQKFRLGRNPG